MNTELRHIRARTKALSPSGSTLDRLLWRMHLYRLQMSLMSQNENIMCFCPPDLKDMAHGHVLSIHFIVVVSACWTQDLPVSAGHTGRYNPFQLAKPSAEMFGIIHMNHLVPHAVDEQWANAELTEVQTVRLTTVNAFWERSKSDKDTLKKKCKQKGSGVVHGKCKNICMHLYLRDSWILFPLSFCLTTDCIKTTGQTLCDVTWGFLKVAFLTHTLLVKADAAKPQLIQKWEVAFYPELVLE